MEETVIKRITAGDLLGLDKENVTVLDLRESDEVLVKKLGDTVNIPFSKFTSKIDELDRSKPVYVLCRTGDLSEEVTEILTGRGYDAYSIEGGYDALVEQIKNAHGVRIVACQMSMDIMGIRQEELIDGVELGGAATFIGSGEQSDMSLFI